MKHIAIVVALSACGGPKDRIESGTVMPYTAPEQTQATPTETGPRVVTDDRTLWCYDDAWNPGGDCYEAPDGCSQKRAQVLEATMFEMYGRLEADKSLTDEQRKRAAAKSAEERWTKCEARDHAACFDFTEVISGTHARACSTNLKRCQKQTSDVRNDPDFRIGGDCYVWRRK